MATGARDEGIWIVCQPPFVVRRSTPWDSFLGQPRAEELTGGQYPPPSATPRFVGGFWKGATMRDTQAGVPSAYWLGAQLAFKDSMVHGILQFTPSIAFRYVLHRCESRDIRCRESFLYIKQEVAMPPWSGAPTDGSRPSLLWFLGAVRAGVRCLARENNSSPRPLSIYKQHVHGSFCFAGFDNDPSAGSPTETLLRLLLPLNDKVQWTSRDVAGGEPPTSPRSEHFTGPFNR